MDKAERKALNLKIKDIEKRITLLNSKRVETVILIKYDRILPRKTKALFCDLQLTYQELQDKKDFTLSKKDKNKVKQITKLVKELKISLSEEFKNTFLYESEILKSY